VSVYVDDVEHGFGRMKMCHLWADSLPELLEMVDAIGVQRKWIQGHPELSFGKHKSASWVHFDIAKAKKSLAISAGAILTDRYGPLEHCAKLDIESGVEARMERGRKRLAMLAEVRDRPKLDTDA